MKKIISIALVAFLLTGCAMNIANESVEESPASVISASSVEEISSVETDSAEKPSSPNVSKPVESTSSEIKENGSSSTVEKPAESSSASSEAVESSSSTKPVDKPVSSSSSSSSSFSSSSNPVEKPAASSFSSSSKPVSSSSSTSSAKPTEKPAESSGDGVNTPYYVSNQYTIENPSSYCAHGYHKWRRGLCVWCGTSNPCKHKFGEPVNIGYGKIRVYCTICGDECKHIWKEAGVEVTEEAVEIKETHDVVSMGFDTDLCWKNYGMDYSDACKVIDVELPGFLGNSGSTRVKTTGTKTITKFYHECSECGYKEEYNTEETVTPDDKWEFVSPRDVFFKVLWYDVNNIPEEVYDACIRHKICKVMQKYYGLSLGYGGVSFGTSYEVGIIPDDDFKEFENYVLTHSVKDAGFLEYLKSTMPAILKKWMIEGHDQLITGNEFAFKDLFNMVSKHGSPELAEFLALKSPFNPKWYENTMLIDDPNVPMFPDEDEWMAEIRAAAKKQ